MLLFLFFLRIVFAQGWYIGTFKKSSRETEMGRRIDTQAPSNSATSIVSAADKQIANLRMQWPILSESTF